MLQNEVDTLRSDNVKLYEKIKFLQSYPTKVTLRLQTTQIFLNLKRNMRSVTAKETIQRKGTVETLNPFLLR